MSNFATQYAIGHFGKKVVAKLEKRGIRVIGAQALPGPDGSFANADTGYVLDDNGECKIRRYREVLEMSN